MPNFTQHLSFLLPSSRSQSLKMVPAPHLPVDTNDPSQHQDSSTCHSTDQSHKDDDIATQVVHPQDQCISSGSDESYKKLEEAQMKPILFMGNPSFIMNDEKSMPMNQQAQQHAYAEHYLNGLYTAYGPQPMIQPHIMQIAPARVALPLDLSEDGPIYVNAKQYHGILRRRQIRAKLEAQNKLVKNRRPYLHESRHKHALNRVRGSGGRFLPTKKAPQQSNRFMSYEEPPHSDHERCNMIMDHGFSWGIRGNEKHHHHHHYHRGSVGR
ncbi:hypothetical protein OSB04_015237 [Centaurea solstitialis]|uniref:Nuclear transcription factor Y subunit n=1 Tax=Centaurea solstitialis TaxID=347529 RepID=A0AA38W8R5_9ASTR|nr:hypothetical protein OSB04_015237 [Centaurea solstitialis]